MLRKLKFEAMAHPPYSPDFAPSDNHLFGPLKRGIKGPSINLGARREGSGTYLARCAAQNLLFGGLQEACATMDQVR